MLDVFGCFRGIALGQPEEENVTSIAATIEEWVGKITRLCQGGAPSFQNLSADGTRYNYETASEGLPLSEDVRCWIYWAVSGALPLGSQKKMMGFIGLRQGHCPWAARRR